MDSSLYGDFYRKEETRQAGFGLDGLSDVSGHWCMEWRVYTLVGLGRGTCGLMVQTGRGLW